MKVAEFFAFAEEMDKALRPMVEEIKNNNSERFKEAYRHAATAFKLIAEPALRGRHFVRDTGTPGKLIFYIFEDAREVEHFLRWNTNNDKRLVALEDENDELTRCYFEDFIKTSSDWVSPCFYKMIDRTPTVTFDIK